MGIIPLTNNMDFGVANVDLPWPSNARCFSPMSHAFATSQF